MYKRQLPTTCTTLDAYQGKTPSQKYTLREQLFFASAHIEILASDDKECVALHTDCEFFKFPARIRDMPNEIQKYKGILQFRSMWSHIAPLRHTEIRKNICRRFMTLVNNLQTEHEKSSIGGGGPKIRRIATLVDDKFLALEIDTTTKVEPMLEFVFYVAEQLEAILRRLSAWARKHGPAAREAGGVPVESAERGLGLKSR